MIRFSTKPFLLLSSKLALRQLSKVSINTFTTYKQEKNLSNGLIMNNNFSFAELPKHKVLNVKVL